MPSLNMSKRWCKQYNIRLVIKHDGPVLALYGSPQWLELYTSCILGDPAVCTNRKASCIVTPAAATTTLQWRDSPDSLDRNKPLKKR